MKFGQDYQNALLQGEYPQEWINSAISYKKLKKCIRQVRQELLDLGLDKEVLDNLWQSVGSNSTELLQYSMGGDNISFTPRLTIVIDPTDGSPVDAWLTPDTRRLLLRLARSSRARNFVLESKPSRVEDEPTSLEPGAVPAPDSDSSFVQREERSNAFLSGYNTERNTEHFETVEVPLTSDSEFFQILQRGLADLDRLQEKEQERIRAEIEQLREALSVLKMSKSKKSQKELDIWRRVFEQYVDAEVFLSSHEADAGLRDANHANKQYQAFQVMLKGHESDLTVLGKNANGALERFLHINIDVLRLLRFQDINKTALAKIMKKFDKQTALRAQATIADSLAQAPFMTQDLARATCVTISEEILSIVPQMRDYLCPVCFSISWRPIRLRCNHVFCIRCMITMQQKKKNNCPLCREPTVMEANSDSLDEDLSKFLKMNFKDEVKMKQKENEIASAIDRWGPTYGAKKCIVM